MEVFIFAFSFLEIILASEGVSYAHGEDKIIFRKIYHPYQTLNYLVFKPFHSYIYNIPVEKCTTGIRSSIFESYLFVFFSLISIFASEGAGTATGEAKILFNSFNDGTEIYLFVSDQHLDSFTTGQGVKYKKDENHGR